jgi:hypothetical protein
MLVFAKACEMGPEGILARKEGDWATSGAATARRKYGATEPRDVMET